MSRCYPYPPPGYQKKAQQPDLSVPAVKVVQKEKHKSKDKDKEKEKKKDGEKERKDKEKKDREKKEKDRDKEKKEKNRDKERRDKDKRDKDKDKESKREKRKKDVEANGTSHGDKDPRSSKLQRTDLLHSTEENGRVREIKATAAVVARPLDRDGKDAAKALDKDGKDAAKPSDRDGKDAAKPRGSVGGPATRPSSVYSKEQHQPNGKVDLTLPPVVLSKPVTGGNQAVVEVEEAISSKPTVKVEEEAASRRPSNHNHHIDSNNSGSHRPSKLPDFSVCDTMPQSWSAIDDEEWLSSSSERVHQKPKAQVVEDTSQDVWADAIFLPSVDMYALPYVVPY